MWLPWNYMTHRFCCLETPAACSSLTAYQCFAWYSTTLGKGCVPGWIPGYGGNLSWMATIPLLRLTLLSLRFYIHASGHTDPGDLVTVSPATNEGSATMHGRGDFTSEWPKIWMEGRHNSLSQITATISSTALLLTNINVPIYLVWCSCAPLMLLSRLVMPKEFSQY